MHCAIISAVLLATFVASSSAGAIGAVPIVANDVHAYPQYKTSYGVADKITGDQKAAVEYRDGGVTKGSYSFVQPDGVVRTVNYIVTPLGGFQAQVLMKGVAGHPAILGIGKGIGGRGLLGGLGVIGNIGSPVIAASSSNEKVVAAPSETVEASASSSENGSNGSSETD